MSISVCAYCRVSTNSRDQQNSYENQQLYFKRELTKNPDYSIHHIYADKGISGTKLHREAFDQMLKDAGLDILEVKNDSGFLKYVTLPSHRIPKFKYIYVKNTSRFARNVEVESILRDLARMGVYVYFLDLAKSTENEADITYIQIFNTFDERESRDRRTKVLFGIEEGNKKGIIRTNSKLYGYKYIKDYNRLEVIDEEAEIIRLIFDLYSQNKGIRQIMNYLNDNRKYTRQGKPFVKNSIRRILDNEKYMGFSNNCKYTTGTDLFNRYVTAKRKDDGSYKIEDSLKIPQIIEPDLFYACKKIMDGKINHENQKGIKKPTSKYNGMIFCSSCGSVYISNVDKGRRFYNCKLKKQKGITACNNQNVSEAMVDEAIEINLRGSMKNIHLLKEDYKNKWYYYAYKVITSQVDNSSIIKEIKSRLSELEEKLEGLYDLYALKKDNRDLLIKHIDSVEEELTSKREELLKYELDDTDIRNKVLDFKQKLEEIDAIPEEFDSVDEYIKHIHVVITDGPFIDVNYKFIEGIMTIEDLDVLEDIILNSKLHRSVYNTYVIEHNLLS